MKWNKKKSRRTAKKNRNHQTIVSLTLVTEQKKNYRQSVNATCPLQSSTVRFHSIASLTALMTEILFNWKWMVYCISVSARVCARSAVSACSKKEFHTLTHSVVLFATCIISHTSTKSGIKKHETIKCIRCGCVRAYILYCIRAHDILRMHTYIHRCIT